MKYTNIKKVQLDIYNGVKYERGTEQIAEEFRDIEAFEVKQIPDYEAEAMGFDFDDIDPYQEYLVLYYQNGQTEIWRNSYVDMFKAYR